MVDFAFPVLLLVLVSAARGSHDEEDETICLGTVIDLAFVVDVSRTVCDGHPEYDPILNDCDNWHNIQDFMDHVVERLDVGRDRTRVGLVRFSSEAETVFNLDEFYDQDRLRDEIHTLSYVGGSDANTYEGLVRMREDIFNASPGDRHDVRDVALFLTNSVDSRNLEMTISEASEIRDSGIELIAVGVAVDRVYLQYLSSASGQEGRNYFSVPDFDSLDDIIDQLMDAVCNTQSGSPSTTKSSTASIASPSTTKSSTTQSSTTKPSTAISSTTPSSTTPPATPTSSTPPGPAQQDCRVEYVRVRSQSDGMSSQCPTLSQHASMSLDDCLQEGCQTESRVLNFRNGVCSMKGCPGNDLMLEPQSGGWDVYVTDVKMAGVTDKSAAPLPIWIIIIAVIIPLVLLIGVVSGVIACRRKWNSEKTSARGSLPELSRRPPMPLPDAHDDVESARYLDLYDVIRTQREPQVATATDADSVGYLQPVDYTSPAPGASKVPDYAKVSHNPEGKGSHVGVTTPHTSGSRPASVSTISMSLSETSIPNVYDGRMGLAEPQRSTYEPLAESNGIRTQAKVYQRLSKPGGD